MAFNPSMAFFIQQNITSFAILHIINFFLRDLDIISKATHLNQSKSSFLYAEPIIVYWSQNLLLLAFLYV